MRRGWAGVKVAVRVGWAVAVREAVGVDEASGVVCSGVQAARSTKSRQAMQAAYCRFFLSEVWVG